MRVGLGYDLHALVPNRPLILGGITVPFEKGFDGHSDADVLCHAIGDALLGAAALDDIGDHFSDSDPKYKDVSSIHLLTEIVALLKQHHFVIVNVDATIVAQAPTFGSYKKQMKEKLKGVLNLNSDDISIKAKTNEHFDATGRGEAIAVHAVVLIDRNKNVAVK